ncbi:mitochondrial import inner membrane translocase subunit Tim10B [Onthophagus taurus]|uniref:mitochondrial import inner membrane translocase subunit Tim10B n=1 Tax=Onthophagus taurus TaxID=166361 RepID=UPI000C20A532|nr:mitochondrial import inner membrane translocase subunit Tim10B [Onthophagus taurus]
METHQLKTFRDFLQLYNVMSDLCFSNCITTLNSRELNPEEELCVDRCASKYINCNNRLIKVYSGMQEKIVERRMKELQEMEQKALEQQKMLEEQQSVNEQKVEIEEKGS